jgi:hypothetical protein
VSPGVGIGKYTRLSQKERCGYETRTRDELKLTVNTVYVMVKLTIINGKGEQLQVAQSVSGLQ